ncbi:flavin reductase family protein [Streptomyces sp. NPDC014735]|uniref:flavin reductase family protein n=1 Tax=unclassified Streptomyces TaxID=2593676 RepID=UPI0036F522A6
MSHATLSHHRQQAPHAAKSALLCRTLRRHAAGVTIVTVPGPAGFTATSFCSVSLDPALISFCVATGASVAPAVCRAERFAVHLLGADNAPLADRFARSGVDRFAGMARLHEHDGLPILTSVPAWLSARVVARHPAGDHLLVIGEVDAGGVREHLPALVRHDGAYATPTKLAPPHIAA